MTKESKYLIEREEFQKFRDWLHLCFKVGEDTGVPRKKVHKVCREVLKHLENTYPWDR